MAVCLLHGCSAPGWQGGCWQQGSYREVGQLECSSCLASSSLPIWHDKLSCFMAYPWPGSRSEVCHSYLHFLKYLMAVIPLKPLVESSVAKHPLLCSCCIIQVSQMILLIWDIPSVPRPIRALQVSDGTGSCPQNCGSARDGIFATCSVLLYPQLHNAA